jgi:hypothetical protein
MGGCSWYGHRKKICVLLFVDRTSKNFFYLGEKLPIFLTLPASKLFTARPFFVLSYAVSQRCYNEATSRCFTGMQCACPELWSDTGSLRNSPQLGFLIMQR